ncbi:hypothetical protein ACNOYE_19585 [Nannocystaceae bacterium ST9]
MVSQSAVAIVELRPAEQAERVIATLALACGCVVTHEIARDRILDDVEPPRAVGKYPCPLGHPVGSL